MMRGSRLTHRLPLTTALQIHGLVLRINKTGGYSLHMPQKKRANGMHVDMVMPLDNETRRMLEEKVLAAYRAFADQPIKTRL